MASTSIFHSSTAILDKSEWVKGQNLRQPSVSIVWFSTNAPIALTVRASYADELVKTAKTIASPGRGILAMDESNATCGKRNCYGIKVDKGLVPLAFSNDESWCQGLDGLASRSAAYYQQGARFAKWRTVVSILNGPSALVVKEATWGLARYAAISQDNGLVPIVEPEILLDGEHESTEHLRLQRRCGLRATPQQVADYTLKLLQQRIPPAVPGIMFLLGGQSEVEATLHLNAMNQTPNPWHVSFSYARALQNTCLKTWGGRPKNVKAAQDALLLRASANSLAQLGKYTGEGESEEAKKGMFVKGYVY
nr:fructose-bisphosphate aldolase 1, chloroplastic [Tanacetum cinerariifolium]GEX55495.1 fructose-bisphosphate aldolase 1, chloroplastic [Tanacetum cinerariifolium]